MSSPMVTTIIPTLNRPALLRRSIRSVLNQTMDLSTIVIVHDSESDDSARVISELDPDGRRITHVRNQQRLGIRGAFAAGLELAMTPYVSFLGDDDYLLPDFYQAAVSVLESDPEVAVAAGGLILTRADGTIAYTLDDWGQFGRLEPKVAVARLLSSMTAAWTAALFRREPVLAYPLDERLPVAFDMLLMLQICARYPTWVIGQPFAVQRVGEETFSGTAARNLTMADWRLIETIFCSDIAPSLGADREEAMAAMTAGVRRIEFDASELALLRPSSDAAIPRWQPEIDRILEQTARLQSACDFYREHAARLEVALAAEVAANREISSARDWHAAQSARWEERATNVRSRLTGPSGPRP